MGADNDIVERLPLWKTGPVLREHPGYFLVHERDIDEAAAEIVRLRGEVGARITPDWVIGYFPADVAEEVKRAVRDAFGEWNALSPKPAPAMPNGVEDMHDDLSTPDLLNEAERIAVNQYKDGRYAAARILRILCHRLRAADNRDAAGVEYVSICGVHQVDDPNCRNCNTKIEVAPAAVPAGEAVGGHYCDNCDGVAPETCFYNTTPPAPVQAAPQEGDGPWLGEALRFLGELESVGNLRAGEVARGLRRHAAHPSACELGADTARLDWLEANCVDVADEYGTGSQLYFGTYATAPLRTAIDRALQHRGDSRGGDWL